MDPRYILEACLHLWDELPFLLGREAWTGLYHEIEALLRKLMAAQTEDEQLLAATDIVLALAEYPNVRNRLAQTVEHIRTERSTSAEPHEIPLWERVLTSFDSLVHPRTATRYTDIYAPRQVQRGIRAPVNVALTVGPEKASRESESLALLADRSIDVSLRALSTGLEIVSTPLRRLRILHDGDSPSVSFIFKGTALGRHVLALDFHQKGRRVGHVELPIEVIRDVPPQGDAFKIAGPIVGERPVPQPVDLEIEVSLEKRDGEMCFGYTLNSPSGIADFFHTELSGPKIEIDPEKYRARLTSRLEKLLEGRGMDGELIPSAEIPEQLAALGRNLYRDLFAGEMQVAYRRFRESVKTIQIIAEDPWIPWEILQPYDDSDPDPARLVDDPFLCRRFQVTRWLAGSPPKGQLRASQLACIEVSETPGLQKLPFAAAEHQILADLALAHGLRDASPEHADKAAVKKLLGAGGNHILHFVAHGDFRSAQPDEAKLLLVDGSGFSVEDLQGPLATRLRQDSPLVFLNACRLGQQAWALTGLGGWAERWVRQIGCGAFVAPLWAVSDRLAFEFAKIFYAELEAEKTFGQAVQAARLQVREIADDNPTWMAYALYAHPNGRLVLSPDNASAGPEEATEAGELPEV